MDIVPNKALSQALSQGSVGHHSPLTPNKALSLSLSLSLSLLGSLWSLEGVLSPLSR